MPLQSSPIPDCDTLLPGVSRQTSVLLKVDWELGKANGPPTPNSYPITYIPFTVISLCLENKETDCLKDKAYPGW